MSEANSARIGVNTLRKCSEDKGAVHQQEAEDDQEAERRHNPHLLWWRCFAG